ncbi:hypothetical protein MB84_31520 (plasmid) [Pandoraea oxalativorans]|uniref:Uncharacterized protein n=1 Tax=Pandoraea oxalativorans TaxID=573737 RepID=A0A192B133_9BURK|nr:hypothetical protein MB84_31520 [Pandoraea oxalativorans]
MRAAWRTSVEGGGGRIDCADDRRHTADTACVGQAPQQAIGVLVRAALPWTRWGREDDFHAALAGETGVIRQFLAPIRGQ